jgi:hypothetical protein
MTLDVNNKEKFFQTINDPQQTSSSQHRLPVWCRLTVADRAAPSSDRKPGNRSSTNLSQRKREWHWISSLPCGGDHSPASGFGFNGAIVGGTVKLHTIVMCWWFLF